MVISLKTSTKFFQKESASDKIVSLPSFFQGVVILFEPVNFNPITSSGQNKPQNGQINLKNFAAFAARFLTCV